MNLFLFGNRVKIVSVSLFSYIMDQMALLYAQSPCHPKTRQPLRLKSLQDSRCVFNRILAIIGYYNENRNLNFCDLSPPPISCRLELTIIHRRTRESTEEKNSKTPCLWTKKVRWIGPGFRRCVKRMNWGAVSKVI